MNSPEISDERRRDIEHMAASLTRNEWLYLCRVKLTEGGRVFEYAGVVGHVRDGSPGYYEHIIERRPA